MEYCGRRALGGSWDGPNVSESGAAGAAWRREGKEAPWGHGSLEKGGCRRWRKLGEADHPSYPAGLQKRSLWEKRTNKPRSGKINNWEAQKGKSGDLQRMEQERVIRKEGGGGKNSRLHRCPSL